MLSEYCQLLKVSRNTYFVHKREQRPIVLFLEKYFSKEDLEEYLTTGKVSRLDSIEDNIFTTHIRTTEILKLLSIIDTETLQDALKKSLNDYTIGSSTVEYLKQKRTKLDLIKKLRNLLDDLHNEKQDKSRYVSGTPKIDQSDPENQSWYEFEQAIDMLNDKIGFDFNSDDRVILDNIISRYRVYNTLHNFKDNSN